ncbi:MAG TPA: histidine phosphatase family protein [Thermomicrobiaceae bacterium]|nr:histidine phosphatase family protein [Thermomicrobiaceae bacterium]
MVSDEGLPITTRIFLIRHGASHHKEDGIVGGPRGCRGLTQSGRQQTESVSRRLALELPEPVGAIYSSVLPRAVETAEIVATALGVPDVAQDCRLCTWHTPANADGKPWVDYRRESSLAGGGIYRPFEQGNESWSELVGRTGRALEEIAARHAGEKVIVVAHAETITASLIVFGGLPLTLGFDVKVAPTSLTEWTTEGNPEAWPRPRWTLVRLTDSAHLP